MTTNATPSGADAPGHQDTKFNEWYATKFKVGMERGPLDKYVARQAWFAALSAAQDAPAVSAGDVLPTVHRTAPESIYLCIGDEAEQRDAPFDEIDDITWSTDQPVDVAVPYVRADLLPHPTAQQGEPSAWHRIEEDAEVDVPLDTDLLLAWWDQWSEAWKIEANYAGSERGGWRHGRATHWMPLPAPPSAAQQKGASNG